jgi:hypothetical protein
VAKRRRPSREACLEFPPKSDFSTQSPAKSGAPSLATIDLTRPG